MSRAHANQFSFLHPAKIKSAISIRTLKLVQLFLFKSAVPAGSSPALLLFVQVCGVYTGRLSIRQSDGQSLRVNRTRTVRRTVRKVMLIKLSVKFLSWRKSVFRLKFNFNRVTSPNTCKSKIVNLIENS